MNNTVEGINMDKEAERMDNDLEEKVCQESLPQNRILK